MSQQQSYKRGMRSTSQKLDSSRHDFDPVPATAPVAGAFGRRRSRAQDSKEGADFVSPRERSEQEVSKLSKERKER